MAAPLNHLAGVKALGRTSEVSAQTSPVWPDIIEALPYKLVVPHEKSHPGETNRMTR